MMKQIDDLLALNEVKLALGEKTCELLRIAYPNYDIQVEFNPLTEILIFSVDSNTYKVNLCGDSEQASVIDIAEQLLSKFIKNHK